jgi:hypothetical protein
MVYDPYVFFHATFSTSFHGFKCISQFNLILLNIVNEMIFLGLCFMLNNGATFCAMN